MEKEPEGRGEWKHFAITNGNNFCNNYKKRVAIFGSFCYNTTVNLSGRSVRRL
jgi:hypothetical protein